MIKDYMTAAKYLFKGNHKHLPSERHISISDSFLLAASLCSGNDTSQSLANLKIKAISTSNSTVLSPAFPLNFREFFLPLLF